MIINDPEVLNKLAEWRARATAGTLTLDEMREAIRMMRGNRLSAASAAGKSAKKPLRSADEMLSEL